MRRRTTILDVLREECAHPQQAGDGKVAPADSARDSREDSAADQESLGGHAEAEVEHSAPRRRRRRRYAEDAAEDVREAQDEGSEGEMPSRRRRRRARGAERPASVQEEPELRTQAEPKSPPATPRAVTTRPASERPVGVRTEIPARRLTRASGRKRGLLVAEWMQSDVSMPRGYLIAAAATLLVALWGVFMLGRINGSSAAPSSKGGPSIANANSKPGRMADLEARTDVKPVTHEGALRRIRVGGYKVVEYPADAATSVPRLKLLRDHLLQHLEGSGAKVRALKVVGEGGVATKYFLVVTLPAGLVGEAEAAEDFFTQRIRSAPPLRDSTLRFDFASLDSEPVDVADLAPAR